MKYIYLEAVCVVWSGIISLSLIPFPLQSQVILFVVVVDGLLFFLRAHIDSALGGRPHCP